jgi:2-phospho-L-lactate/phosphoenolpyruvate guanylyltransferase
MSGWTALVPLKTEGLRKTRLAARLSDEDRLALAEGLARHVIETLQHCPSIDRVLVVSDLPPPVAGVGWQRDEGAGLNPELERARSSLSSGSRVLIIHADLPLLCVKDVEALLEAAGQGIAIAPDRHKTGTNALALGGPAAITLSFGPNSFARHCAQLANPIVIADHIGLSLDIDTMDDLDAAVLKGFPGFAPTKTPGSS